MTIKKQVSLIKRILNNTRLHTCSCGFQCMPMVVNRGIFKCPKCGSESEVK